MRGPATTEWSRCTRLQAMFVAGSATRYQGDIDMGITRRQYLQATGSIAALAALGRAGSALAQSELPSTMIWSTYDVGSTGYVEASAIADAFGKKYGSRIRLQPSGTAIGREI